MTNSFSASHVLHSQTSSRYPFPVQPPLFHPPSHLKNTQNTLARKHHKRTSSSPTPTPLHSYANLRPDVQRLLVEPLVRRHLEVERRRALADPPRDVVVRAVARAEVPVEDALVRRRDAPEVRADGDHDGHRAVAREALVVPLGVLEHAHRRLLGGVHLRRRAVVDEDRLAAPHDRPVVLLGDLAELDLEVRLVDHRHRRQAGPPQRREHVPREEHREARQRRVQHHVGDAVALPRVRPRLQDVPPEELLVDRGVVVRRDRLRVVVPEDEAARVAVGVLVQLDLRAGVEVVDRAALGLGVLRDRAVLPLHRGDRRRPREVVHRRHRLVALRDRDLHLGLVDAEVEAAEDVASKHWVFKSEGRGGTFRKRGNLERLK